MALHRFAVAVVLVCAGVMLLSACGLGMGNYKPPPALTPVNVLLVVPATKEEPERIIGSALIGGVSMQDLTAQVTLQDSACGSHGVTLRGSAGLVSPPWFRLQSDERPQPTVEIKGTLGRLSRTLAPDLFPFQATLRLGPGCGMVSVRAIEVRRR